MKTVAELQAWIDGDATSAGGWEGPPPQPYVIVRKAPRSGTADWDAVAGVHKPDERPRWNPYLRHAIGRAKSLFDLR